MPEAVTLNVAFCPAVTVRSAGWEVIAGAAALTVSRAVRLVTLPAALLTTTLKPAPLSALVALARV